MSEWIEGPPPEEDGDYAVQAGPIGHLVWRREGWWKMGDGKRCERGWLVSNVDRHVRLPDIPKPPPLPRRFRAKYMDLNVIGVEFHQLLMCVVRLDSSRPLDTIKDGEALVTVEHRELTEIRWIDPAEPQEAKQP